MIILLFKLKKKTESVDNKKKIQLWIINKIILYRASFYNIYKFFNFIL